jgi:hypothetical protein
MRGLIGEVGRRLYGDGGILKVYTVDGFESVVEGRHCCVRGHT